MNDKPKLFEEFNEPHLFVQNYHARNSRFNFISVTLDTESKLTIFRSMKCLVLLPPRYVCHVCMTML